MNKPELSMVIPVRDEIEAIPALLDRVLPSLEWLDVAGFEVIFVDDGSKDGTAEKLELLTSHDPRCKVLRLRRSLGKGDALAAGFGISAGQLIATIDADLQEPPEEIQRLVDRVRDGFDMVVGWRQHRADDISRRISSKIYNCVVRCVGGPPLRDGNCGFKVLSRELALSVPLSGGHFRYMHLVAARWGYRVTEVAVPHRPRQTGTSHFGISRAVSASIDLITLLIFLRGQDRPGRSLLRWGLGICIPGILILGFLGYSRIVDGTINYRYPLLVFGALLSLAGLQLMLVGCLAEWFSGKTNMQSKSRRRVLDVQEEHERLT